MVAPSGPASATKVSTPCCDDTRPRLRNSSLNTRASTRVARATRMPGQRSTIFCASAWWRAGPPRRGGFRGSGVPGRRAMSVRLGQPGLQHLQRLRPAAVVKDQLAGADAAVLQLEPLHAGHRAGGGVGDEVVDHHGLIAPLVDHDVLDVVAQQDGRQPLEAGDVVLGAVQRLDTRPAEVGVGREHGRQRLEALLADSLDVASNKGSSIVVHRILSWARYVYLQLM